MYTPTPFLRKILHRRTPLTSLGSRFPQTEKNAGPEVLPPYLMSWSHPGDTGQVSLAMGTIPASQSQPSNDPISTPRKSTTDSSVVFGIRKQASVIRNRTDGNEETLGRSISATESNTTYTTHTQMSMEHPSSRPLRVATVLEVQTPNVKQMP